MILYPWRFFLIKKLYDMKLSIYAVSPIWRYGYKCD